MNAMTWWDHETESIWSQPLGQALEGPLRGTKLELLPSQLVPWQTWREAYPDTLALEEGRWRWGRPQFHSQYVIGVALEEAASAYRYQVAAEAGTINDAVGSHSVVVHVDQKDHSVHVYLRRVNDRVLTFIQNGEVIEDLETGSTWSMDRGLALEGPLRGQALRPVPYIPAFPDAWRDFYPHSRWYNEGD